MITTELHRESMLQLLNTAIAAREEYEKLQGYTGPSAQLSSWKNTYNAVKIGATIKLNES